MRRSSPRQSNKLAEAPRRIRPKIKPSPEGQTMTYQDAKDLYNTPAYKEWRTTILIRDKYTCQMCGQVGGAMEVHHCRPVRVFPELVLDIQNGICLCKFCHQVIVNKREDKFCYIFSRIVKLNSRRLEEEKQE